MRSLESLEISQEMYGCFLTPLIMQKLGPKGCPNSKGSYNYVRTVNMSLERWGIRSFGFQTHQGVCQYINHRQPQPCLRTVGKAIIKALGAHIVRGHINLLNVMW